MRLGLRQMRSAFTTILVLLSVKGADAYGCSKVRQGQRYRLKKGKSDVFAI